MGSSIFADESEDESAREGGTGDRPRSVFRRRDDDEPVESPSDDEPMESPGNGDRTEGDDAVGGDDDTGCDDAAGRGGAAGGGDERGADEGDGDGGTMTVFSGDGVFEFAVDDE